MKKFLITFDSTHQVLKAEKKLKEKFKEVTTIPTPEELSSDCGVSLQLTTSKNKEETLKILTDSGTTYNNILQD
ncbi:MAG: DUF3343 domain-containing protein [Elusimicrobiota bacterium]